MTRTIPCLFALLIAACGPPAAPKAAGPAPVTDPRAACTSWLEAYLADSGSAPVTQDAEVFFLGRGDTRDPSSLLPDGAAGAPVIFEHEVLAEEQAGEGVHCHGMVTALIDDRWRADLMFALDLTADAKLAARRATLILADEKASASVLPLVQPEPPEPPPPGSGMGGLGGIGMGSSKGMGSGSAPTLEDLLAEKDGVDKAVFHRDVVDCGSHGGSFTEPGTAEGLCSGAARLEVLFASELVELDGEAVDEEVPPATAAWHEILIMETQTWHVSFHRLLAGGRTDAPPPGWDGPDMGEQYDEGWPVASGIELGIGLSAIKVEQTDWVEIADDEHTGRMSVGKTTLATVEAGQWKEIFSLVTDQYNDSYAYYNEDGLKEYPNFGIELEIGVSVDAQTPVPISAKHTEGPDAGKVEVFTWNGQRYEPEK